MWFYRIYFSMTKALVDLEMFERRVAGMIQKVSLPNELIFYNSSLCSGDKQVMMALIM